MARSLPGEGGPGPGRRGGERRACGGRRERSQRLARGARHRQMSGRPGRRGPQESRPWRGGAHGAPAPSSSPAGVYGPNAPSILTSRLRRAWRVPARGAPFGPPVGGAPGRWGTGGRAAACGQTPAGESPGPAWTHQGTAGPQQGLPSGARPFSPFSPK